MNNLAWSYQLAGRPADALALHGETLNRKRAKLGPDHPDTLTSMNNLALAYDAVGRTADALALHEETLRLRKARLGPDDPQTLVSMNNVAAMYRSVGRLIGALALLREAADKQRHQSTPLDLAYTLTLLGMVLTDLGRPAEAEPALREALALREKHLPAHNWRTAQTRCCLGGCLAKQQKFVAAEPLFLQAYQEMREAKGAPRPRRREVLEWLVHLYTATRQKGKAEEWRKKLETVKQEVGN
jgi:tetratricopeptide (TPR) repeat protein